MTCDGRSATVGVGFGGFAMVHRHRWAQILWAGVLAGLLGGCGNSGGSAGLTTASLLDGAPAANEDGLKISNDDPLAKPMQVGWTAARAQKCGFNFDAAGLKRNYLAAEAAQGAAQPQLINLEKAYDKTFQSVSAVAATPDYCTDRKAQAIKTDLNRHLAGDYTARFAQAKAKPTGGLFDGLASGEQDNSFNPSTFWQDQEDKKNGVRR